MAVYKNYYANYSYIKKFNLIVICLYLFSSTINCTIVNGERIRHRHQQQLEKPSSIIEEDDIINNNKKTQHQKSIPPPIISCPNCLYKSDMDIKSETDNLRLDAIKRQILSKLGLKHKPNVTHTLPREIILETLVRAEDSDGRNFNNVDEDISTTSYRSSILETVDVDDFYGRTSEIISFAEQGKIHFFMIHSKLI